MIHKIILHILYIFIKQHNNIFYTIKKINTQKIAKVNQNTLRIFFLRETIKL